MSDFCAMFIALFGRPEKGVTVWLDPHELQAKLRPIPADFQPNPRHGY